jgi:Tol biopolymer transport system component
VAITDPGTGADDIWLRDLERGTLTRMTFDPTQDRTAIWSPDGRTMAFVTTRDGKQEIYTRRAGGGSPPERLTDAGNGEWLSDWSPDGKWIVVEISVEGQADQIAVPADGEGEPFCIACTPYDEILGKFSPDGTLIAYQSEETGSREIYVQPFPDATDRWQISTAGGRSPQWRADGKELFYLTPDNTLVSVSVETGEGFRAGIPTPLFQARVRGNPDAENRFQVAGNGQRFLFNANMNVDQTEPVTVVLNWEAGLGGR